MEVKWVTTHSTHDRFQTLYMYNIVSTIILFVCIDPDHWCRNYGGHGPLEIWPDFIWHCRIFCQKRKILKHLTLSNFRWFRLKFSKTGDYFTITAHSKRGEAPRVAVILLYFADFDQNFLKSKCDKQIWSFQHALYHIRYFYSSITFKNLTFNFFQKVQNKPAWAG